MHPIHDLPRYLGLILSLSLLVVAGAFGQGARSMPAEAAAPRRSLLGTDAVLPTVAWNDAGAYVGREVYVVGKVVRTGSSRTGHVFLNFDPDYRHTTTIFIRSENVKAFPQPPQNLYRNRLIRVRGFPYEMNGQPNISVASPDRITILPDDAPVPGPATRPESQIAPPGPRDVITVGSYNVLNLFDAADDPYAADETTGPKPQDEIEALAKSIRELDADVLALVEVENRGVLQQFVDLYLSEMRYEVVLFEGNDTRGIDVAVLSRLPVGPVTSHRHLRFPDTQGRPTRFQRDLLEVRIEPPGGGAFDLFVVHLKSKGGEEDGGLEIRLPEARQARLILDRQLKSDPDAAFLVVGDFNDTMDSQPLLALLGSGSTALTAFIDDLPSDHRVSYNQKPHRSMIDFILASPGMARRYVAESYNIPRDGSPETTGSDHNPVVARFRLR